jgi:cyclophilin family peptidyl-prolyl cis-trans isomerase
VLVTVEKFGTFRIRPFPDEAPHHVACFLGLVARGYFDGMSFHRVIPGFLVQTGDPASRTAPPDSSAAHAPPWRLPPEPTHRTHHRGTVSLAWQGDDPGSAGTQWFVALAELPQLDGHATIIGEVVEGMETVEKIAQVSTHRDRRPLRRVLLESARLVARPEGERGEGSGDLEATEAAEGLEGAAEGG